MKNVQKLIGVIAVLAVVVTTSLFTAGCATGGKAITIYQDDSVPREEHARLFIGDNVKLFGVDDKELPLALSSKGQGLIILLAPGSHTVAVKRWVINHAGFEPEYPAKLSFTAEAGKIYVVSTNHYYNHDSELEALGALAITSVPEFYLRELSEIPVEIADNESYPECGFSRSKETLKRIIEEEIAKL